MKNSIIKKGLGILSVAVLTMALFVNTNSVSDMSSEISLASLISLNSAEAENPEGNNFYVTYSDGESYNTDIRKICYWGGSSDC